MKPVSILAAKPEKCTYPLFVCMFLFGAAAVISQSLLIRELMVVLGGNEICIGIALGTWLAAVACGGLTGARVADRARAAGLLLFISAAGITLGLPGGITLVRLGRLITAVSPGEYVPPGGSVLIAALGTLPAAFFVGFGFPVVCRMAAERTERATAVGRVYVTEGLGSLAGGMLFSFFLIGRFDAFIIAAFCGTLLAAAVGLAVLLSGGGRGRIPAGLCVALAVVWAVFLVAGLPQRVDRITVKARWRAVNPALELLDSRESVYQNISVGEWEGQYSFFGNGRFMLSFPDEYESARAAHLVMAEHPAPRTVLIIGAGMEGMAGDVLAHPVDRVDCVHLDPELTRMVEKYMKKVPRYGGWLVDSRLKVHHEGGRAFVNASRGGYDLVFLNVPDPATAMLNRYYTEEFYREVKGILAPGGVVGARVSSPSSARIGKEVKGLSGSVYATLQKVFSHCVVTPGEVNYFFASDSPGAVTSDPRVLARRYASAGVSSRYFASEVYSDIFPAVWVKQVEEALRQAGRSLVNTDMNPVTYFYGLVLWGRYSGSAVSDLLLRIRTSSLSRVAWAVAWCVFALAAGVCVRRADRGSGRRASALIAVGTTGLAAMAMALVIMLGFQSFRGYVYQKVGIIVGAFMGGLACGGMVGTWWAGRSVRDASPVSALLAVDTAVAGTAALLPFALGWLAAGRGLAGWADLPFYSLAVLAGFVTGTQFPLANRVFQAGRDTGVGRSAGLLEWADHLGGMAGAVLGGVLLVPLVGVSGACLTIAALKVVSVTGLAVAHLKR